MVLFVAAFQKGGALATLYPVGASTFVIRGPDWPLWAYGTADRPVNIGRYTLLLVAGMYFMGR